MKSTLVAILMLAIVAVANAKLCLYHNSLPFPTDEWYKSVVVYDQWVGDWNACNYWNWHARNLNTFESAKSQIKYICWKQPMKELGFILRSALTEYPDKWFTDSCNYHDGEHMYEYLTGAWYGVDLLGEVDVEEQLPESRQPP
ncbi:hypothetical protein HDU96_002957, partial [Phlyctochytrium bullatum]